MNKQLKISLILFTFVLVGISVFVYLNKKNNDLNRSRIMPLTDAQKEQIINIGEKRTDIFDAYPPKELAACESQVGDVYDICYLKHALEANDPTYCFGTVNGRHAYDTDCVLILAQKNNDVELCYNFLSGQGGLGAALQESESNNIEFCNGLYKKQYWPLGENPCDDISLSASEQRICNREYKIFFDELLSNNN